MANSDFVDGRLMPVVDRVALWVIDEAHCISCWGHDFRPDYRRLPGTVGRLNAGTPVLCTTATATARVAKDITGDEMRVEILHSKRKQVLKVI